MSKAAGYALVAVGAAAIVVGSIGVAGSGGEGSVAAESGPSGSTSTTGATGTGSVTGATGGPSAEVESTEAFLPLFSEAIREGDAGFLLERLHPAVIAFYGEQQCRAAVGAFVDPNADFVFISAKGAATYPWRVDGRTTPVDDVVPVRVEVTSSNGSAQQTIHLGIVKGELRWFTDCGDPA